MAENKDKKSDSKVKNVNKAEEQSVSAPVNSIEDKLRAAESGLSRADENAKAREIERKNRQREAQKEDKARAAEAEKKRRADEKAAQKVAEAKLAEFDYAQNYRKKLARERDKAISEEKRREAEERARDAMLVKEAEQKRIADILERDRQEAKARGERADALVSRIVKREEPANPPAPVEDEELVKSKISEALREAYEAEAMDAPRIEGPDEEIVDAPNDIGDDGSEAGDADLDSPASEGAEVSDDAPNETDDDGGGAGDDAVEATADEDAADEDTIKLDDLPLDLSFGSYDSDQEEEGPGAEPEDDDGDVLASIDKWFNEPDSDAEADNDDTAKASDKKPVFEITFDEDGNLVETDDEDDEIDSLDEIPVSGMNPDAAALEAELKAFREQFKEKYDKVNEKTAKKKTVEYSHEEQFLAEDIVGIIRETGDALEHSGSEVRNYHDISESAIGHFKKALKHGKRALDANRDETDAPEILVSLMRISGKIIEIRCHNLETYARLKSYNYINNARMALRRDINDYNEYAVAYASLTGEQLTRLSTFLPDNIATGKAEAVVPTLTYDESYVQVRPGEDGSISDAEGAMLTPITPIYTAETLFGMNDVPRSRFSCGIYRRLAKSSIKELDRIQKQYAKALIKTSTAEKKYDREMKLLKERTPASERESDAYKHKEFALRLKYGKMLTSLRTVKVNSAFDKTKTRLLVCMLAVEREKLSIAIKLLYETYRKGRISQKNKAQDVFIDALSSYNKCAEKCRRALGGDFAKLPTTLLEKVCRGSKEIKLPAVAYKRTLVETVGDSSRTVSMALSDAVAPNEKVYLENSQKILGNKNGIRDRASLQDDAPMVDRASAMAKVMLDTLRESAQSVGSGEEFQLYTERSEKVLKFFKRSLKATERAISRAFDENGVVTALVENLRVITNIIELRRLNISIATRLARKDYARSEGRALYKNIELYNGRAIDYMSIVGEQFTRITSVPINVLAESADKLRIPTITYKDNYIEVFPKDPLLDPIFEKPVQRRGGYYTPLLMRHYRLTENRAVETTVINAPFVFDVTIDEKPIISWWHPVGFWQYVTVIFQPIVAFVRRISTNAAIWFVDESLVFAKEGLKGRQNKAQRIRKRLERKLARANDKHDARIASLETVIHESDRYTASYQKKLYKINVRFSRKVYRIKMRWMKQCPAQTEVRLLLERLVLERERLTGINKVLIKYRNYGRITFFRNVLVRFRKSFLNAINEHNETARKLSEAVGVSFSQVSSSVADEIIRYGNQIKFPQIVCCREIIETIGDVKRSIGDKWHGYGIYAGASGTDPDSKPPLMSVGAMGYSTNMGIPYFSADFDKMSMIGMTAGGVPIVGFGKGGAAIPFTGTPMMLGGTDSSPVLEAGMEGSEAPMLGGVNVTDPYSGINSAAVDSAYVKREESKAKSGATIETPVDIETAMIEDRFIRALDARSMTMVDGVKTWWKLVGSEINLVIQRALFLRPFGFLRFLLPEDDEFLEEINTRVPDEEERILRNISKLGAIIDIECSRLYSATKAGIRRSQRKFSKWLYADIERYNELVAEYNNTTNPHHQNGVRLESEKIQPLSLNIPDRIAHRLEDRPESPPKFRLRNKVRTAPFGWRGPDGSDDDGQAVLDPINTCNAESRVEDYVNESLGVFASGFGIISVLFVRLKMWILRWPERRRAEAEENGEEMGRLARWLEAPFRDALLRLYNNEIKRRTKRTNVRRGLNEIRHYYLRYEKARAMKRYNRRIVRAIGVSSDPIKYQNKLHRVLRNYVSCNFRIDYNMRIYQLLQRALRVNFLLYVVVLAVLFIALIVMSITSQSFNTVMMLSYIFIIWAALPIVMWVAELVYWVIYGIVWIIRFIAGNRPPNRMGAKDVESNRYGLVLNCFVCEQHKILAAAVLLINDTASKRYRKNLIAAVNEYNKARKTYSETLRVHIDEIDVTSLIDKIVSGGAAPLTEIQNFYYVRELIQINDFYKIGKKLTDRESKVIIGSLNGLISQIARARDDVWRADMSSGQSNTSELAQLLRSSAIDDFSDSISLMISALQSDDASMLDDEERFDLKNRLVSLVHRLGELGFIDAAIAREYSRDFVKLIDHIGGLQERVIITNLALDNMIF